MTTMDFSATLAALRRLRVETGSLVCFGCGHEHNCSTHGCAILRNAVEHMEAALSNYDSLSALVHRLETELFQSTLPSRRATHAGGDGGAVGGISIHAPREGSDQARDTTDPD